MTELYRAIALALGSSWRVEPDAHDGSHARITDGIREFSLRLDGYGPRLKISGVYPFRKLPGGGVACPDIPYKATIPSITVAATKTGAVIAADIRRRLMDAYESLRLAIEQRHAAANAHEAATGDAFTRLAAETGARISENGAGKHLHWPDSRATGNGYIWNEQVDGEKVSLDLRSLPVDIAIQIINLVHGRKSEPKWEAK
jgi:hypothetical protein